MGGERWTKKIKRKTKIRRNLLTTIPRQLQGMRTWKTAIGNYKALGKTKDQGNHSRR
jgi:hypothetical protein